ncbi:MAG: chorismate-binding protein, partial [Parachlamydiaceae bacterium]
MKGSSDIAEWLQSGSLIGRHDGTLLLGWGKRLWRESLDLSRSCPQFYFPDFFLEEKLPWLEHGYTAIMTPQELLNSLPVAAIPSPALWQKPCRTFFQETFSQLQSSFSAGELVKAVPFVNETTTSVMTQDRLLQSLRCMISHLLTRQCAGAIHPYGTWDRGEGIFGATPEVLCQIIKPERLDTMACAGTKGAGIAPSDLLNDTKELHEHQIVIQGMIESLSPYGKVVVGDLKLLHLPSLTHLLTPIHVEIKTMPHIEAIIRALHPTPALGAFPRKAG